MTVLISFAKEPSVGHYFITLWDAFSALNRAQRSSLNFQTPLEISVLPT